MAASPPLHRRMRFYGRHGSADANGVTRLGDDEIEKAEHPIRSEKFVDVGPDEVGECNQDACLLAAFVELQAADFVVGLDDF